MKKEKLISYLQDVYQLEIQKRIAYNAIGKIENDMQKQRADIDFSQQKHKAKNGRRFWIAVWMTPFLVIGFLIFNWIYLYSLSNIPRVESRVMEYSGADLSVLDDSENDTGILLNPSTEEADAFYLRGAKRQLERLQNDVKIAGILRACCVLGIGLCIILCLVSLKKKRDEQKIMDAYSIMIRKASQNKLQILEKNHAIMIETGEKITNTLNQIYSLDVIYSKYRYLEACGTFLDYLLSGRAQALEATPGFAGAYTLFEEEKFRGEIRDKLNQILQNQRILIKGQREIMSTLNSIEQGIQRVCNELGNVKDGINKMTQVAEVNSFYNSVIAYNTSVSRRIMENYYF